MTPTDIEAVLPYVPAGISSGDLTDREERWAFAERLMLLYTAAGELQPCDSALDCPGRDVPLDPGNGTGPHRAPNDIRHGDTWEVRDGRAVIVASNDWGPPRKGTHEYSLRFTCPPQGDPVAGRIAALAGFRWSCTPDNDGKDER